MVQLSRETEPDMLIFDLFSGGWLTFPRPFTKGVFVFIITGVLDDCIENICGDIGRFNHVVITDGDSSDGLIVLIDGDIHYNLLIHSGPKPDWTDSGTVKERPQRPQKPSWWILNPAF
jgi:hypothetical protein